MIIGMGFIQKSKVDLCSIFTETDIVAVNRTGVGSGIDLCFNIKKI